MTTRWDIDAADERLSLFTSLTNHQLRNALDPKMGVVIVESEIAIRVALAEGLEPLAFLLSKRRLQSMEDVLSSLDDEVPVYVLTAQESEKICGYAVTRGALAAMRRPQVLDLAELLGRCRRLVVLEGITDTANVGAIFRNAAALGADGVICAPTCADPLTRRSVRVSMGNVFKLPWLRLSGAWPHPFLEDLKEAGFERLALALVEGACDVSDPRLKDLDRVALFFGSEGYGLSLEVVEACDHKVIIPMMGGVDSLNVAASTAVALWELFDRGVQHS
jgi:tRNA G18 (ribose-2'-O)-methylase SpoU